MTKIKRALISVSDKTGLVEFARELHALGVEIISTGGTSKALADAGIPVVGIEQVTHFPEMLEGRVKTLHPAVHGGILADRSKQAHMDRIAEAGIKPIDMVVVNLYPFRETVAKPGVKLEEAIENIDIGGPSMIRSAAKNHSGVAVVVEPGDYRSILEEMKANDGAISLETRRKLATKAFGHTAAYDAAIYRYLSGDFLPERMVLSYTKAQGLRYGENPHQQAAFYREEKLVEPCIANAKQLNGKELSFCNFFDADGALELIKEFSEPAAAIIKHSNPCGCALGKDLADAFRKALEADPLSAFGGIIALNRVVDTATAELITGPQTFFEVIIAPGYEPEAYKILTEKKKWGANLRVLEVGDLALPPLEVRLSEPSLRKVVGGLLVQERDLKPLERNALKTVTRRAPTEQEMDDLLFAWTVVKHVKSNAIVVAKGRKMLGMGAGQPNRVNSVRLALEQAGEAARGGVLASDAFFPKPDGPETAAQAGLTAIIQPGGSVKDEEVIAVADENNIAMVFTGMRHFRH